MSFKDLPIEKQKELIRKYKKKIIHKEWYKRNKKRIGECRKEYRQRNKDRIKEFQKEYRQRNIDKIKEYRKEYRQRNKDRMNESFRIKTMAIRTLIERNREEFNQIYSKLRGKQ